MVIKRISFLGYYHFPGNAVKYFQLLLIEYFIPYLEPLSHVHFCPQKPSFVSSKQKSPCVYPDMMVNFNCLVKESWWGVVYFILACEHVLWGLSWLSVMILEDTAYFGCHHSLSLWPWAIKERSKPLEHLQISNTHAFISLSSWPWQWYSLLFQVLAALTFQSRWATSWNRELK